MTELRLFFSYALRHKYSYLFGVLTLFFTNWFAVNIPLYIGNSIDLLGEAASQAYQQLIHNIYWVIGFSILMMVTRTLSRMAFFNPGRLVERDIKNDAFKKLTELQQGFYSRNPVGSLISIVNNDINGIRALAGVNAMNLFNIFFSLSMTPMKMWQISPSLTVYCLVPVFLTFVLVNYAINKFRKLARQRMQDLQALSTQTVNYLNGIDVIKGYQIQDWALGKFEQANANILDVSLKQLRINTFIMPLLNYTESGLKIIILGVGGWYLVQSTLTIGEITAFLTYVGLLAMPFMSLGRLITGIQIGLVSLKSMGRILTQKVSEQAPLSSDENVAFGCGLEVRNLTYRYPTVDIVKQDEFGEKGEPFALHDVSFHIKPGEKVAILGRVGSGKTTLLNCLNRFHDIPAGSIFLDGTDITEFSQKRLRQVVRTITQEPFLFSDTLKNNVEFGSAEVPSHLSLDQALYQSAMSKEVKLFPQGTETLVGEKGILLSGGQKQRISLARGVYTPTQLIMLDNALSAVDNDTERFLLDQIFNHLAAQSCLIVSHRQAVLEQVDYILLLDEGRIIAQGSHVQLLTESPVYKETWQFLKTQVEG